MKIFSGSNLFALTAIFGLNISAHASGARFAEELIGENPTVAHVQSSKRLVDGQADTKALAVRAWMETSEKTRNEIKAIGQRDGNRFYIRALEKGVDQHKAWASPLYKQSLAAIPADRDTILEQLDLLEPKLQAYETRKKEIDSLSTLTEAEKATLLTELKNDAYYAREAFVRNSSEAAYLLGDNFNRTRNDGIYNILLDSNPEYLMVDVSDIFNIKKLGSEKCFDYITTDIATLNLASENDRAIVRHLAYHPKTFTIRCSGGVKSSAKYDERNNRLSVTFKPNTRINPIVKAFDGANSESVRLSQTERAIREALGR